MSHHLVSVRSTKVGGSGPQGREPERRVEANTVQAIVMGLAVGVVAWIVLTRWPRDWVRLLVAEVIVGAVLGALLTLLARG